VCAKLLEEYKLNLFRAGVSKVKKVAWVVWDKVCASIDGWVSNM